MTRDEAIKRFEEQLTAAMAVLDSGFGTRPGESDRLYRERKEMAEIALQALRNHEEHENQPLTLAELRQMNGETVYCLDLNADVKVSAPHVGIINISYAIPGEWGVYNAKGMTLYRTRPENMK